MLADVLVLNSKKDDPDPAREASFTLAAEVVCICAAAVWPTTEEIRKEIKVRQTFNLDDCGDICKKIAEVWVNSGNEECVGINEVRIIGTCKTEDTIPFSLRATEKIALNSSRK